MEPEGILLRFTAIGKPADPGQICECPAVPTGTFALCRCFLGKEEGRLAGRDDV
jgi:hypothetical protein